MTDEQPSRASDDDQPGPTIKEVQAKLDEIAHRLEKVERLIQRIGPDLEEVSQSARAIRQGFVFYDGMVKLVSRFTRTERLRA
ncbi:MAG: hypothetical protein ACTSVD_07995 [Candidatus Thorarchaeota archaeon]|nr:MAG: hypothetical protein DRO73_10320 [Candidatus Thorarchaeota archaeon]RLI59053.1 MAG: hypothetical protein DRO93_08930 [Candidatus Thorarchaeota archaeon]